MKIVFILGAHRTGTKAIAKYFATHYGNEANSFHQFPSLRLVNIASNLFEAGRIPEKWFVFIVKSALVRHIEANSDKSVYIISNGFNFLAAKYIMKFYEDVRIVHIVRRVDTYISSYLNFIDGRVKSRFANGIIPFWQPSKHVCKKFIQDTRNWNLIQFRFAIYWLYKNQRITDLYAGQRQYGMWRFEDIMDTNQRNKALKSLAEFMGMHFEPGSDQFFDRKLNASEGNKFTWENGKGSTKDEILKLCRDQLIKYGYE